MTRFRTCVRAIGEMAFITNLRSMPHIFRGVSAIVLSPAAQMYSLLLHPFWFSSQRIGRHDSEPYQQPCSILSILALASNDMIIAPISSFPLHSSRTSHRMPSLTSPTGGGATDMVHLRGCGHLQFSCIHSATMAIGYDASLGEA